MSGCAVEVATGHCGPLGSGACPDALGDGTHEARLCRSISSDDSACSSCSDDADSDADDSTSDSSSGSSEDCAPTAPRARASTCTCSSMRSSDTDVVAASESMAAAGSEPAAGTLPPGGSPCGGSQPAAACALVVRSAESATTPDGWRLHLHRVRAGPAAAGATPRQHPVLLCPGLASGGVESFDLEPAVSLAQYLAERGFDVWWVVPQAQEDARARGCRGQNARAMSGHAPRPAPISLPLASRRLSPVTHPLSARCRGHLPLRVPDLRGNGRSQRPSWWDRKTWWTVRAPPARLGLRFGP
jgi:hypothetical protein